MKEKTKRTWSREVSVLLFVGLAYLAVTGSLEALSILTLPVFGFAALAFGFKQEAVINMSKK